MRERDLARRRGERAARRQREIATAAAALLADGVLSHETVAARTDVPLGYLRWAYPDVRDLAGVADLAVAS